MREPLIFRIFNALDAKSRAGVAAFLALALIAVPVLHLWVPAGSPFHVSTYAITLIGKIMCYAIVALAMDLIWGYGGILSLGHGIFFALGGYAFGMYLMRQIGRDGSYHADLPDFMVFLDWKKLPWYWSGSDSFGYRVFDALGQTNGYTVSVAVSAVDEVYLAGPGDETFPGAPGSRT